MSKISAQWSPALWLNSAHVEHWLQQLWPTWRRDDIRSSCDEADRWYWTVRDYAAGRSRILGMPTSILERTTLSVLRHVLEDANWRSRIDQEALLIERSENGDWIVGSWAPQTNEQWFADPRGGHFVAFVDTGVRVSSGPPARLPQPFLALHGRTWSAMGPQNPRAPQTYTLEELKPFLPILA
jgi:hypothetical protein